MGRGWVDAYPVVQWEKRWSDMTAASEIADRFPSSPAP
jgi:hypothetical protein